MRYYCFECGGEPCVFTCPPCERTDSLVGDLPSVCPWRDTPSGHARSAPWSKSSKPPAAWVLHCSLHGTWYADPDDPDPRCPVCGESPTDDYGVIP